ncbi:MAG TPA: CRISPR-associated endonuclease Cas2 [Candidatus Hydrogenedentes bacterium]|nr:CRISPR-associated endonuclease Cas2 [Candidatus Hydrogenedentota bacterium]
MKRTRYLVCYDIRDPKRLRKIAQIVSAFGYRLQFSIFECALDNQRLQQLRCAIDPEIKHDEDQIMFVSLGESSNNEGLRIDTMGLPYAKKTKITII